MKKQQIHIYGVGGAGVNIVGKLNLPNDAAGFPEATITAVDTSMSNMLKGSKQPPAYLVPGIDGSGKNRAFAYQQSKSHINRLLVSHEPKEFNIVVFGLSGGTGSVIGPLLIQELLQRDLTTIAIAIISTASALETENAYKTIATLSNMSSTVLKKPIACCFYENTPEVPRSVVDAEVDNAIRALAMLASGENEELDYKDLANWLNFHKVTPILPQLVDCFVYIEKPNTTEQPPIDAISVANLLPSKESTELNLGQLYNCVGYIHEKAAGATSHAIPSMHFIISNDYLNNRLSNLEDKIAVFDATKAKQQSVTITTFNSSSSDGFIF